MNYTLQEIASICNGKLLSNLPEQIVQFINTDSRNKAKPNELFVALLGERFNGHQFIVDEIKKGTTCFLISDQEAIIEQANLSWVVVNHTLHALQKLATHHRTRFTLPVVGITGSTGKTIVKEWLYQLLSPTFSVCKSPKSYNSQIGVPLSVLHLHKRHSLALFEAGISTVHEMQNLAQIIQPEIGVLTNIGEAHRAGFASKEEKLAEKSKLFQHCSTIIYKRENWIVNQLQASFPQAHHLTWWLTKNTLFCNGSEIKLTEELPYKQENLASCAAVMLALGFSSVDIANMLPNVEDLPMRFELVNGKNNNLIINDSYSNDLSSLRVALEQTRTVAPKRELTFVSSQFEQSGLSSNELINQLNTLLKAFQVHRLIGIGSFYEQHKEQFAQRIPETIFFSNTKKAKEQMIWHTIQNNVILVKGARKDGLERIVQHIKQINHDTVWEINLSTLIQNLNVYRSFLPSHCKVMAMVKATAYGTEANKLAQMLQHQRVDYLGVAYPEEGESLRNEGITLPILVMNASPRNMTKAIENQLDISLYSFRQLYMLLSMLKKRNIINYPIHIKVETGMNRLGFNHDQLHELIQIIQANTHLLTVKGIMSHLANADNEKANAFTWQQIERFKTAVHQLASIKTPHTLCHLLNSAGIVNSAQFPMFDMVRLGIGLHGVSTKESIQKELVQVGRLKATIAQLKTIQKGETVGYGQTFTAIKKMKIAVVSIGYADGYDRRFGNGVGYVLVNNKPCKTVGAICMDMLMVDVTHLKSVKEGTEVILTSSDLPITELATQIGTIPYELFTSISTRVQRQFVYE